MGITGQWHTYLHGSQFVSEVLHSGLGCDKTSGQPLVPASVSLTLGTGLQWEKGEVREWRGA